MANYTGECLRAYKKGKAAWEAGIHADDNPYYCSPELEIESLQSQLKRKIGMVRTDLEAIISELEDSPRFYKAWHEGWLDGKAGR